SELFTPRQLVALSTFSGLIGEARERARADSVAAGLQDGQGLEADGVGATAYGDAIAVFMALCLDKLVDYNNTLCTWNPTNQNIGHLFTKQVLPMTWDFPETSPLAGGLSFESLVDGIARTIVNLPTERPGKAFQHDAKKRLDEVSNVVISTDPPYYDNVPYADLS